MERLSDPMDRAHIEVECKECHILDVFYPLQGNGEVYFEGWTACVNGCCWLCRACEGKLPNVFIRKINLKEAS